MRNCDFTSVLSTLAVAGLAVASLASNSAHAAPNAAAVANHWTAERRAAALPRDLVIDSRGLAYLRRPDGGLSPHGHSAPPLDEDTRGKPPSDGDSPVISDRSPHDGATVGSSATFTAVATDNDGISGVTFVVVYPNGNIQNFNGTTAGNDTWTVTLIGFTDGDWGWYVVATDAVKGKKNSTTSSTFGFTVDTGGGPVDPPSGDTVENEQWLDGGVVQVNAGRIYFEMPGNPKRKRWRGYVCSGTVVTDDTEERSVIITAAHCVYDDVMKAFARNVLFIPNQQATSGSGTDSDCSNDPMGCWSPAFGVVDTNWTTRTFPGNKAWDYAYYVVSDTGAHSGNGAGGALEEATGGMIVSFDTPNFNDGEDGALSPDFTHGLGYSYSDDPNFMYCAEDMTTEGADNWWLPLCGLSGGSSGGPWVQPMDLVDGDGPIMSVNSWGYTTSPGMAGPFLSGTSAECLFELAKKTLFAEVPLSDGDEGIHSSCF